MGQTKIESAIEWDHKINPRIIILIKQTDNMYKPAQE